LDQSINAVQDGLGIMGSQLVLMTWHQVIVQLFKKGKLELQPGCNAAQTLESSVTGELNKIREAAGNVGLLTLLLVALNLPFSLL
jgi:hypothetical protein